MSTHRVLPWMALAVFATGVIFWPGCRKTDSTTAPTDAQGSIITVTGKVVGGNLQPIQHFPVAIAGLPATVSDANGNFSIKGVKAPYDVTVIDPATSSALVYIGLSRSDPTIIWQTEEPGGVCGGNVTGVVSGGGFAPVQGSADQTQILYLSPGASSTVSIDGPHAGDFNVGAMWCGSETTTGTVFALQFAKDLSTGLPAPNGFKGFGVTANVTMKNGTITSGQTVALQALAPSQTGQLSASIQLPLGFTLNAKALFLRPNTNGLIPILNDSTATTSVTYNAPIVTGGTLTFHAVATDGSGNTIDLTRGGLTAGGKTEAITVSSPPELSVPVAGADFVDTTTQFSWRPLEGGVHVVFFTPAAGGNPSFEVVTTGQTCRLPNLRGYGLTLPRGQQYSWNIIGLGPVSSVDAAADPMLLSPISRPGNITSSVVMTSTPARPFRTAP
jgi:hypothetical protein